MPRHDHLYVPTPKTKIVPCADCGEGIEVGWKTRTPKHCLECAMRRATAAMTQMHEKRGPYYERWRFSIMRVAERLRGEYLGESENLPQLSSTCDVDQP